MADSGQLAVHARSFARARLVLDPWHYLPLLERKPGALRNGAPFVDWTLPAPIAALKDKLRQQPTGDRACVEILLALRAHGSALVTVACELALEHRTLSAAVVLNPVHRLKAPPPPAPLPVSEHLRLACEPQADGARYDQLRACTGR